jgi:molybdopterin molybdotransferase
VEPGKPLSYGQIYDSNSAMLAGAIREAGAQPFMTRAVADDPDALRHEVMSHLATADAFVSTGGVSVGERDPVKAAFQGREVEFFRVAMQPGMPQGFGLLEGKPFFALPGNPVSVFVSFEVFVRPVLTKMMSRAAMHRPTVVAQMDADIAGPEGKTVFARVLVRREGGVWVASPTGGRGSNLMGTVARANGLAIIPPGVAAVPSGASVSVMVFRSLED